MQKEKNSLKKLLFNIGLSGRKFLIDYIIAIDVDSTDTDYIPFLLF
jgi:hypothetical protein